MEKKSNDQNYLPFYDFETTLEKMNFPENKTTFLQSLGDLYNFIALIISEKQKSANKKIDLKACFNLYLSKKTKLNKIKQNSWTKFNQKTDFDNKLNEEFIFVKNFLEADDFEIINLIISTKAKILIFECQQSNHFFLPLESFIIDISSIQSIFRTQKHIFESQFPEKFNTLLENFKKILFFDHKKIFVKTQFDFLKSIVALFIQLKQFYKNISPKKPIEEEKNNQSKKKQNEEKMYEISFEKKAETKKIISNFENISQFKKVQIKSVENYKNSRKYNLLEKILYEEKNQFDEITKKKRELEIFIEKMEQKFLKISFIKRAFFRDT